MKLHPDERTFLLCNRTFTFAFIYPQTLRIVGAPRMTSQPVSSFFLFSTALWGELQACPFPDVVFPPLPLSALSSSPFHCALYGGFWPDLMNRSYVHTTAFFISLQGSGGLCVIRLSAGTWHRLPHWSHGLCTR